MMRMRTVGLLVLSAYLLLTAISLVMVAPLQATMLLGRPVAKASLLMVPHIVTILVAHLVLLTGALAVYIATARLLLHITAGNLSSVFLFDCLAIGHCAFLLQAAITVAGLAYIGQQSGWNMLEPNAVGRTMDFIAKLQSTRMVCWVLLFLGANTLIARHVCRSYVSTHVAFGAPLAVAYLLVDLLTLP